MNDNDKWVLMPDGQLVTHEEYLDWRKSEDDKKILILNE